MFLVSLSPHPDPLPKGEGAKCQMTKWKMVLLTRSKPLSILRRCDECLHHFGVGEVAAEAVQLVQPEVESGHVCVAAQITEVLHRDECSVELEVRGIY